MQNPQLQQQLAAMQRQQAIGAPAYTQTPLSFLEWLASVYPPDEYVFNQQWYGVSIAAAASASQATGNINVQVPIFVMGFRSKGIITATGAAPAYPYRIGIAHASGNDWTYGQWLAGVVTGDAQFEEMPFYWPREVPEATQLTVTVNNAQYATAITVDAAVVGLEVRKRNQPIRGGRR